MLQYKKDDTVLIKSKDWYNQRKDKEGFISVEYWGFNYSLTIMSL